MNHVLTLLQEMTPKQKEPLAKILGLKVNSDSEIILKFSKLLRPLKGWFQDPMTYSQILNSIAKRNNEVVNPSTKTVIAERELYLKLFQIEFEKLNDEEKKIITAELEKAGLNVNQISSLSGLGALGAAQLSGFGVYLLASSTVGAITSFLGVTLPFAFYTGMSSAIALVIGPIGFLAMGVMIFRSFRHIRSWDEVLSILNSTWKELGSLVRGDYARAVLCFKYLAASRIVLETNLKKEMEMKQEEKQSILQRNYEIANKIDAEKLQINKVQEIINGKRTQIRNLENEIKEKQFQIARLNSDISTDQKRIENHQTIQSNLNDEKLSSQVRLDLIQRDSRVLEEKFKKISQ